jgi:hypothetical protein
MVILNMSYSKSEIEELSLRQFSESQLQRALKAFNGLAQLFGREFIDEIFGNAKVPSLVMYITETWENWKLVEPLKKSEEIVKRWKEGFYKNGIIQELDIFAHLIRCGIVPDLFPSVGTKKADCKINYNKQIIYIEVTHRDLSKRMEKVIRISDKIHKSVEEIFGKRSNRVRMEILRLPANENELKKVINWLQDMRNKNKEKLDDLVCFSLEEKTEDGQLLSIDFGPTVREDIIPSKSEQLPEDSSGIICFDTSVVGQDFKDWIKSVERIFQSSLYERLSAIFLYNKPLSNKKTILNGCFINNPFARYPIDSSIKCIFEKMFNTNE